MSKKKPNEVKSTPAPVISKIPLPISDSPLVIDLPDGQKLVVGKMIQGSVIEVATWRGTGRPDSRTSRLMLGMSIGDVNSTPDESAQASNPKPSENPSIHSVTDAPAAPKSQRQAWIDYLAAKYSILKFLKNIKLPAAKAPKPAAPKKVSVDKAPRDKVKKFVGGKVNNGAATRLERGAASSEPSSFDPNEFGSKEDADISAWLDQISEKARVRTGSDFPTPATRATRSKAKPEVSLDDVFSKQGAAKKAPARRPNVVKKSSSAPKKRT